MFHLVKLCCFLVVPFGDVFFSSFSYQSFLGPPGGAVSMNLPEALDDADVTWLEGDFWVGRACC